MGHVMPDRYDELRREWISEHASIWNVQKRRAELLNRQIRKRIRMAAGARPSPYDDNVMHPLWARRGSTIEIVIERVVIGVCALLAPLGWLTGRLLYEYTVRFIPERLRAYPIPALLCTAVGIGTITALLYSPDGTLAGTVIAPYVLAQIPATFAAAGIYGILNGWLAVEGSASWWPLTPPPLPVELTLPLGPDDLTAPSVFETFEPAEVVDMTPTNQISQSQQPLHLVRIALTLCLIGVAWMSGAVAVGIRDAVFDIALAPVPVSDY